MTGTFEVERLLKTLHFDMSADDPCGTIQIELDRLRLCLLGEEKIDDLNVRVDFELISTLSKNVTAVEGGEIDGGSAEDDVNHNLLGSLIWSDKKIIFSLSSYLYRRSLW